MDQQLSRRLLLAGGVGGVAALALGGAAAGVGPLARFGPRDLGPEAGIPDAPEGDVRLVTRQSTTRSRPVGFYTAVPAGHGDGRGLPVCLVLHGASATTADYAGFGFARFLTAAVQAGVPPFVLAGADGGRSRWLGDGAGDDPQRLLREEVPAWCAERGFDAGRLAAYGWSMGGFGALTLAAGSPTLLRAVSALSPAVSLDDPLLRDAARLDGRRVGLWCGRSDRLFGAVQELAARIPGGPSVASWGEGAHTRRYWNGVTVAAFRHVGTALATPR